ncbi:hypothetical protein CK203_080805 [Vitis vinifera]|uniref:Uncharacterized protein n=1 Tax=Vitis vinifera TaxID=29760 RepID=A0A438F7X8_VITVI|nr:hypothetical protein CK203_080805 [Vitis vinifera]
MHKKGAAGCQKWERTAIRVELLDANHTSPAQDMTIHVLRGSRSSEWEEHSGKRVVWELIDVRMSFNICGTTQKMYFAPSNRNSSRSLMQE